MIKKMVIQWWKDRCFYCWPTKSKQPGCIEVSPQGFGCTREKGHGGKHVACGLQEHRIGKW